MKCVINQPTYIPWIGYLASLDSCDTYVIYDDVQFEHQSWQHRNRIRNQDKWLWLTVPVIHKEGQLINEVLIDNSKNWQKTHWKSIQQNYSTAPYFKMYKENFEYLYGQTYERLIDLNRALLDELMLDLGIRIPKIVYASSIKTIGSKTERLIPILNEVKADEFIEGELGKNYLKVKELNCVGIEVYWFNYQHPIYPQKGEFISHLSAIDLLFNTGDKAIDYIRQGVNLVKA